MMTTVAGGSELAFAFELPTEDGGGPAGNGYPEYESSIYVCGVSGARQRASTFGGDRLCRIQQFLIYLAAGISVRS